MSIEALGVRSGLNNWFLYELNSRL